ncbi:MAG: hypothetical protein H6600_03640 [Flavobacteriales bacterium]|nr:hypothetical protein [Flavobacteriales bacterium]
MKVTLEISKYPLREEYIEPIKDFIDRLNSLPNITVKTNSTSTHVSGDYDEVMQHLQNEIKTSYTKFGKSIFVVKILLGDLINN